MTLFNDTTAVGLFDSGKDLETAGEALREQGFGRDEKITVIDQHSLAKEIPTNESEQSLNVPPSPGAGSTGPAVPVTPVQSPETKVAAMEENAEEALIGFGVDNEEATFYARQVARGSSLLIVETDTEARAVQAMDIMKQANARASVS